LKDTGKEDREQRILDAAEALIIQYGYDKTTMSDIAAEAGVSRGIVYLHFDSKDSLFEALIRRQMLQYGQTWLDHIEDDPRGGTIGGIYQTVLYAINSQPFMAAIVKRDRAVWGKYLRKPDNLFASMQSSSMWVDTLRAMQDAGAVRQDVDVAVMAHIMDILGYGMVAIDDIKDPEDSPPMDVVMETIADMMDQILTPEDGGSVEEGKAIIRRLAATARAQFGQTMNAHEEEDGE
jgi:TetR/AcrR family acrAB operon transcriptional repressor